MAQGWKQVWEDFVNALKGETPHLPAPLPEAKPPASGEGESAALVVDEAAKAIAPVPVADEVALAPIAVESALALPASPESPAAAALPAPTTEAPPLTPRQLWLERLRAGGIYLLLAVVLVGGLWFAGGGRLWAQWTAPKPPAPDVVATFDGGQITTADLEEHFNLLIPEEYREQLRSLETLRLVVQEMVADELARRWAAEQKVDADETFQHTMEHITEDINLDSFNTQLHAGGIPVAESEIQGYYNANRDQFGEQTLNEVREQIRQLLAEQQEDDYLRDYIDRLKESASITRNFELLDVPAPAEADLRDYYEANKENYIVPAQFTVDMAAVSITGDEAAARAAADKALLKLRSGADFASLPAEAPEVQVITNTLVISDTLNVEWATAVSALQPGDISDVFRAGNAFYMVRLIESEPERTQTFDEARAQVLEAVRQRQTDEWMNANGSKTLFTLKSKQYTLGQFYTEYTELPPDYQAQFAGPEGLKELAERLIDRLALVEDTYDQLLQVENKDLIDQTRLDVLKQMMDQQEVDDKIQVTEDDLQQYYDQNRDLMALPPQFRMRYIRIGLGQTTDEQQAAYARADEAHKKLAPGFFQQGAEFAAVAREYSEDSETAANGGEFPGWIGETGDPFEPPDLHLLHELLLQLNVNDISPPIDLGDSVYIVQVIERTEPQVLAFEEARPYIEELLREQKHDELLHQLQERLAQQANVVVYDSVLDAYYNRLTTGAANAAP